MAFVVSHPTGNANVRAVLSALVHARLLAKFATTIAINHDSPLLSLLPHRMRSDLLRRTYPVAQEQLWSHPMRELARILLQRFGFENKISSVNDWASIDSVYQNFDRAVASHLTKLSYQQSIEGVYAYEDGALATFYSAKSLGIKKCIYDLPIAFWEVSRRLMYEEKERLPQWAITLRGGIDDSLEKLERKTQELELADIVVAPSQFVVDSLPNWAKDKMIIMAPFGSPELSEPASEQMAFDESKPLRILFAGSLGQRKGLGDLFSAAKQLKGAPFELVVMGSLLAPMEFYRREFADFIYEPCRPHRQVLELMRTCDVLCLPSVVEGRALVMQEAMSQGLPLIITPNTGGADLIKENETGFLIPVGSPEAIADKILWFIENRAAIPEMKISSRERSKLYTWRSYGSSIVTGITGNHANDIGV